jgi:rhodanese-related sulfurtransferase
MPTNTPHDVSDAVTSSVARVADAAGAAAPNGRTVQRTSRRRFAIAAALAGSAVLGAYAFSGPSSASSPDRVGLEAARAEFEAGRAVLIDIREPNEHATGVAAGARLLPMRQLAGRLDEIPTDPSQPVLLICNTQNRSRATLQALRERGGYEHVRYVEGGMSEWARRGWPMVAPPR